MKIEKETAKKSLKVLLSGMKPSPSGGVLLREETAFKLKNVEVVLQVLEKNIKDETEVVTPKGCFTISDMLLLRRDGIIYRQRLRNILSLIQIIEKEN